MNWDICVWCLDKVHLICLMNGHYQGIDIPCACLCRELSAATIQSARALGRMTNLQLACEYLDNLLPGGETDS